MSNNQLNNEIDDELQIQSSDNDLLSDLSAYNSDDNEEIEIKNPVFNEINDLLNNLQMETNCSKDEIKNIKNVSKK
jgi:hypothetical protein